MACVGGKLPCTDEAVFCVSTKRERGRFERQRGWRERDRETKRERGRERQADTHIENRDEEREITRKRKDRVLQGRETAQETKSVFMVVSLG